MTFPIDVDTQCSTFYITHCFIIKTFCIMPLQLMYIGLQYLHPASALNHFTLFNYKLITNCQIKAFSEPGEENMKFYFFPGFQVGMGTMNTGNS